jgi:hypothetical protein
MLLSFPSCEPAHTTQTLFVFIFPIYVIITVIVLLNVDVVAVVVAIALSNKHCTLYTHIYIHTSTPFPPKRSIIQSFYDWLLGGENKTKISTWIDLNFPIHFQRKSAQQTPTTNLKFCLVWNIFAIVLPTHIRLKICIIFEKIKSGAQTHQQW